MHMLRHTTQQGSKGDTAAQGSISRGGCGALMSEVAETKSFGGGATALILFAGKGQLLRASLRRYPLLAVAVVVVLSEATISG